MAVSLRPSRGRGLWSAAAAGAVATADAAVCAVVAVDLVGAQESVANQQPHASLNRHRVQIPHALEHEAIDQAVSFCYPALDTPISCYPGPSDTMGR